MKQKILYLILGILIGIVLTTGFFMLRGNRMNRPNRDGQRPNFEEFDEENMPEGMPDNFKDKRNRNTNEINQDATIDETPSTNSES